MTALATIIRIARETGVQITDEQRVQIEKKVAHELGGSPHYFAKRVDPRFITAWMQRTEGLTVPEQVQMVRREFGVCRATAYNWVSRR